ncbi:MAG: hypothetical protein HYS08_10505 [Chlamydiae bacterium]|nr:hypothetical protein [Chlamydiota bacterium]MBI3266557.1 hypothetical protein [Chlamydiota bacterium]
MQILIFCALQDEASPLVRALRLEKSSLKNVYQGTFSSHFIQIVVTGMGKENTKKACAEYLKEKSDVIFSCGYAGGLRSDEKGGEVILSEKIFLLEDEKNPLELSLIPAWGKLREGVHHLVKLGNSMTVLHIIDQADEKKRLGDEFSALAVDMEAGFIAQGALEKKIPFFNFRVISDASHEDVEMDFAEWIDEEGAIRKGAILLEVFRHPSHLKYLLKLMRHLARCKKNLVGVVKNFMKTLPSS